VFATAAAVSTVDTGVSTSSGCTKILCYFVHMMLINCGFAQQWLSLVELLVTLPVLEQLPQPSRKHNYQKTRMRAVFNYTGGEAL
jgi:hypothetical protein